jgi:transposase-like protein
VPGSGKQTDEWSPEAKFAVLVETASMTKMEISEYCRSKGLYPEQIKDWKTSFMEGAQLAGKQQYQNQREAKQDKKRIKELERELKRKEKALAEAVALLVLRKKLNALWGENEEDWPRTQSGRSWWAGLTKP